MGTDTPIWDAHRPLARCKGERLAQHIALCDYVALGASRSLRKLLAAYREDNPDGDPALAALIAAWKARGLTPPTRQFKTLGKWSSLWQWQARLTAESDLLDLERQARREAARRKAEDEGEADSEVVIAALRKALGDMDLKSAEAWLDARLKAERLRRLALGMPGQIAQERLADAEGEPLELPQIVYLPPAGEEDDGRAED